MILSENQWLVVGTVASPLVSAAIFALSLWLSARTARRARISALGAAARASAIHAIKAGTISHGLGMLSGWPYDFLLRAVELATAIDISGESKVSKWLVEGVQHIVGEFDAEKRGAKVGNYLGVLVVLEDDRGQALRRAERAVEAAPWDGALPELPLWRRLARRIRGVPSKA